MEIKVWLVSATQTLAKAGIQTARLDSLVLTESVLGRDRSWILAHPKEKIGKNDLDKLNKFIARRGTHYPLAYITQKAYFYNNQFFVNDHVLVPRPESEAIIDLLKTLSTRDMATIIDIGTGSGSLAITAKLLYPKSSVIATDIDPECLEVARKNALSLKADIQFLESDLLKPLPVNLTENSVLLANLPYVPDSYTINNSARYEPNLAIFGGNSGLDLYSQLFGQFGDESAMPNYVITESFPAQHIELKSIAQQAGYQCQLTYDFIQLFSRHR